MLGRKEILPDSSKFYNQEFYQELVSGSLRSARAILPIVLANIPVQSAVDIGCGTGAWLRALEECGVEQIVGYDGDYVDRATLLIGPEKFIAVDLCEDFSVLRQFDLAISLEVAEHLPEKFAEHLIKHLVTAAPVVLFSAAIPGQGGARHINLQWQDYWRSIFKSFGFHPVDLLRPLIWGDPNIEYWYQQNIILYCNEKIIKKHNHILPIRDNISLNIVHPNLYNIIRSEPYLSAVLSSLPSLAWNSIERRIDKLRSHTRRLPR